MFDYPITLDAGPGPLLACLPEPDPDAIAATAVAFANTDGGTLLIGVDAGGRRTADIDEQALNAALEQAAALCDPPLNLDRREPVNTPDGPVIALRVGRGAGVYALHDGQVLARAGSDNRVLNGAEIRRLISARTSGDFDAEIVPGASADDLDPALVDAFIARRADRLHQPPPADPGNLLIIVGALTPGQQVTVAGMLLFSREPQRWLPHSGARFQHVIGTQSPPGGEAHTLAHDRALTGPLVHLIDQMGTLIQEQVRSYTLSGTPDEVAYPPVAVREALVNAVCHRDYRLRGQSVIVRLFSDRLEITSPGGLPGFLTPDHLVGGRYSRNPRLSACLYAWGYIEEPRGLRRMIDAMKNAGRSRPQFLAQPYSLTVRLYNARAAITTLADDAPVHLNARQQRALSYIQQHGSITTRELCALYPKVRPSLLHQDLSGLVRHRRLRKVRSRGGVYYIVC